MTDEQKISDARDDIPFLKNGIYVDNASVSPMSTRVQAASDRFNTVTSTQLRESKAIATGVYDKGRALAAKLVGSSARNIAYVQNTSHGLSLVALGVDWRQGDNLVVCAEEFPSNYLCWVQLASRGVEIRRVPAPDGKLETDLIRQAVDGRTRVVAVSHVQFYSGFRIDVAALGDLCAAKGTLLVVDGTQSIGALGLHVAATGVDVLVVSAHKWLMGPRGIGFASFSGRALDQVTPAIVGWMSVNDPFAFNRTLDYLPDARRFESGTPNGTGIFGLTERLAQIDELGIAWIETRVLDLNELVCELALRHGIQPVYQFERRSRSGIALLRKPGIAAPDMNSLLGASGVFASIRNGAVRIAPHYYNTVDEVEQVMSIMASARA
ncbi:aminotransferase class V-fold PLP-dependent enzyme [Bradyrhizobium sp. CCBAU 45389]|uniref:aminotransferase class V-fold PLP-dependent enzyme n=1 Tax=Bradyrhizobium sp. CCBAU 45389 TaxID=858429 RepID=UPI002305FA1B|nr:aminotransferase class V-fold PLP-dependent enzyme [Bradyrhizobium sp. CCBAU 45389]MDA9401602.1 hypothetical protein [Bradyrhizobium sp. CCBAU 45389]